MLFTFPSRYWFTIGLPGVFSLTRWSWLVHTGFLVSRATQEYAGKIHCYVYRTFTPSGQSFQYCSTSNYISPFGNPTTPMMPKHHWFGLFPFRSPLLRESLLFSLPPVTEMFQFAGFASRYNRDSQPSVGRVAPFGYPRIISYLHLPAAYRSLSRPSSPPRA